MAKTNLSDNPRAPIRAKLEEFADLYRGGPEGVRGNATACYQALHPKAKKGTAEVKGSEYFHHPVVQERLREKTDEVAANADITQERVLKEVARVGLFDPRHLFDNRGNPLPISQLSDDAAAAIAGVKVRELPMGDEGQVATVIEYKLADKNSALEKLMKYLGAYEKDNKQKAKSLTDLLQDIRNDA